MMIDLTDDERDFLLHIALDSTMLGMTDRAEDDRDRKLMRSIRQKLAASQQAANPPSTEPK